MEFINVPVRVVFCQQQHGVAPQRFRAKSFIQFENALAKQANDLFLGGFRLINWLFIEFVHDFESMVGQNVRDEILSKIVDMADPAL